MTLLTKILDAAASFAYREAGALVMRIPSKKIASSLAKDMLSILGRSLE